MTAAPADIAKYTTDGVVITSQDPAIKLAHIDATDGGEAEIEMFYRFPADAQAMLDEKFALLSKLDPLHEGIEVAESLQIGTTIALTPSVPCFQIVDEARGIDRVARTRAFAYETGIDRFSVEILE